MNIENILDKEGRIKESREIEEKKMLEYEKRRKKDMKSHEEDWKRERLEKKKKNEGELGDSEMVN